MGAWYNLPKPATDGTADGRGERRKRMQRRDRAVAVLPRPPISTQWPALPSCPPLSLAAVPVTSRKLPHSAKEE
ncbi:unnamed protein product [Sphagnum balticum]